MPRRSVPSPRPPGVKLRPARAADAIFAEALYLGTMLPLLTALGRGDADRLRARFASGYSRRRSRIVCAAAADVGWMQVSPTATGFHLDQLHLMPDWCGRGIGSALLRRLLARADRAGADVTLDVIFGNPAIRLYRRLGFAIVAADVEKNRMRRDPRPS